MKKIVHVLGICALVVAMSACGGKKEEPQAQAGGGGGGAPSSPSNPNPTPAGNEPGKTDNGQQANNGANNGANNNGTNNGANNNAGNNNGSNNNNSGNNNAGNNTGNNNNSGNNNAGNNTGNNNNNNTTTVGDSNPLKEAAPSKLETESDSDGDGVMDSRETVSVNIAAGEEVTITEELQSDKSWLTVMKATTKFDTKTGEALSSKTEIIDEKGNMITAMTSANMAASGDIKAGSIRIMLYPGQGYLVSKSVQKSADPSSVSVEQYQFALFMKVNNAVNPQIAAIALDEATLDISKINMAELDKLMGLPAQVTTGSFDKFGRITEIRTAGHKVEVDPTTKVQTDKGYFIVEVEQRTYVGDTKAVESAKTYALSNVATTDTTFASVGSTTLDPAKMVLAQEIKITYTAAGQEASVELLDGKGKVHYSSKKTYDAKGMMTESTVEEVLENGKTQTTVKKISIAAPGQVIDETVTLAGMTVSSVKREYTVDAGGKVWMIQAKDSASSKVLAEMNVKYDNQGRTTKVSADGDVDTLESTADGKLDFVQKYTY